MDLMLTAIILGVVEGLTEFLPVSSTGHMILVGEYLNFTGNFAVLFEILIQLGAILAVIYAYKQKIFSSVFALLPGQNGFILWSRVVVAFLPAGVMGFLFKHAIEKHLFSPLTVGIALVTGAFLMIGAERWFYKDKIQTMEALTYRQAFLIGLFQCLALVPGMSRSASTIIGGICMGMSFTAAAEFSFFLAIPTMLGATALSLLQARHTLVAEQWSLLGVGFVVAFFTALIVIKGFIGLLTRFGLKPFAYYRLVAGAVIIFYFYNI